MTPESPHPGVRREQGGLRPRVVTQHPSQRLSVRHADRPSIAPVERSVAGVRISCVDAGTGEPILLLHGYPQSHLCWRHVIGPLSQSHRVIAPDWFGWGASERSLSVDPDYDGEVERIGALADELGLDDFNLFAHDYGGFLALGYAIRHGDRVRRLAILNSRAQGTFTPFWYASFGALCFSARRGLLRPVLRRLPLGNLHRRVMRRYVKLGCFGEAMLADYTGWMDTTGGREWYIHFFRHYEVRRRDDLREGLGTIGCPTAVIWGDRDPYVSYATATELAAKIRHATLSRIAGADHYVMEERPAEVLNALGALLERPSALAA